MAIDNITSPQPQAPQPVSRPLVPSSPQTPSAPLQEDDAVVVRIATQAEQSPVKPANAPDVQAVGARRELPQPPPADTTPEPPPPPPPQPEQVVGRSATEPATGRQAAQAGEPPANGAVPPGQAEQPLPAAQDLAANSRAAATENEARQQERDQQQLVTRQALQSYNRNTVQRQINDNQLDRTV